MARALPQNRLEELQKSSSYWFNAQFQGRPLPLSGGMFNRFEIVDSLPEDIKFVRYWDKAGTEGGGAYSAGAKMGRSEYAYYRCT